jgi:hypothetical protein
MEEDLNFFPNGKGPQLFQKWKKTSIFYNLKDNFNFSFKRKKTSIYSKWKTTAKPKLILGLAKLSKILLLSQMTKILQIIPKPAQCWYTVYGLLIMLINISV